MADEVKFVVKNPSKPGPAVPISVSAQCTVKDLKLLLENVYDGHPSPDEQTVRRALFGTARAKLNQVRSGAQLIYAGQVLKESSQPIKAVLRQVSQSPL